MAHLFLLFASFIWERGAWVSSYCLAYIALIGIPFLTSLVHPVARLFGSGIHSQLCTFPLFLSSSAQLLGSTVCLMRFLHTNQIRQSGYTSIQIRQS